MSPITFYLVLKYLVDIRPLTPLILSKTTKKRRFLVSGMAKNRFSANFVRTVGLSDTKPSLKPAQDVSASIDV